VDDFSRGELDGIMALARNNDSFEDWPWILLYETMDRAFPESKFILTMRDSKKWVRSYENMLLNPQQVTEDLHRLRRILYGLPFPDVTAAQLITRYEQHNTAVQKYFEDRQHSLLIVNWEAGDGWPELCAFLQRKIPAVPFPHANKGNYLKNRISDSLTKINERLQRGE
jgi:hypothetical protein